MAWWRAAWCLVFGHDAAPDIDARWDRCRRCGRFRWASMNARRFEAMAALDGSWVVVDRQRCDEQHAAVVWRFGPESGAPEQTARKAADWMNRDPAAAAVLMHKWLQRSRVPRRVIWAVEGSTSRDRIDTDE